MDWGWDLQSPQEDRSLTLNTDVPRPFQEAAQVTLGLDVSTCKHYMELVANKMLLQMVNVIGFKFTVLK